MNAFQRALARIKGNQGQPSRSWFEVKNADANEAEVSIYDEIGSYGVSARAFLSQLAGIPKAKKLRVKINSPGGSVFEAFAIYNQLQERKEQVTCIVDGIAASAASVIAMAGRLCMPKSAMLMIHMPTVASWDSDADQLRKDAETLDKIGNQIAGVYADKTGMTQEECLAMMQEESWMTGAEAKDLGFADEVSEAITIKNNFDLSRFRNAPARLLEQARAAAGAPTKPTAETESTKMKKLLALLAELHLIASADTNEDQAISEVRANHGKLTSERDQLKTENAGHLAARKKRVEARVKSAIEAKKVKPEREASLIALGNADEANLDHLDDMPTPAAASTGKTARGAQAAPPDPNAKGEERLEAIRAELATTTDPVRRGELALEARKLRGAKDLLQPEVLRKAS